MKKILSLLLVLAMIFSMTVFASAHGNWHFYDIENSKNREAIEALYGLGILEGYGNGKYGPGNTLTRAEACAIIVRAMVEEDLIYESRNNTFTDVDYFAWYRAYVDTAYRNDYMHGHGATFAPNDNVTYAQFATIVLNMLGYNCPQLPGTWPDNAVEYATYLNLYYKVSRHNNDDAIYREDAAQMLHNALDCDMVMWKNGRLVKTGETLEEHLIGRYAIVNERIVKHEVFRNYVEYWTETGTNGFCDIDTWDDDILDGDWVWITLDYLGRTVAVDFCFRPLVTIDEEPFDAGTVVYFDNFRDGSFKVISLDSEKYRGVIDYSSVSKNVEFVSIDGSEFGYGCYAAIFMDSNGQIARVEFYSNSDVNTPATPDLEAGEDTNPMPAKFTVYVSDPDNYTAYHKDADCVKFAENNRTAHAVKITAEEMATLKPCATCVVGE